MDTLHLQRLVSLQISLSPSLPVLAFTGTATRETRCEIISISGLSYPVVTECNPNWENIFYGSHIKLNAVWEENNNQILDLIVTELKLEKLNMPLCTQIYGN